MPEVEIDKVPEDVLLLTAEHDMKHPVRKDQSILKWSGGRPIPAIGDRAEVNFNRLGKGTVVGYFTLDGYLGVKLKLDSPPDWHTKQNKGTRYEGYAHVFGVELK